MWLLSTPGSLNRLFGDLFRKFEGVMLEVFGTIWERFWEDMSGGIIVGCFRGYVGRCLKGKSEESQLKKHVLAAFLFMCVGSM